MTEAGVLATAVAGMTAAVAWVAKVAGMTAAAAGVAKVAEAAVSATLARFKQPRRYELVAELPRNTMGKVQKNLLRETYRDVFGA